MALNLATFFCLSSLKTSSSSQSLTPRCREVMRLKKVVEEYDQSGHVTGGVVRRKEPPAGRKV